MNLHMLKEMKKYLYGLTIILLLFAACKKDATQPVKEAVSFTEYYPNSGVQGTLVTVLGTGFGNRIDAVSATISGKNAQVVSVTPDAITIQAPVGGQSGDITLQVNGETLSIGKYTYQELSVQKISPANGGEGMLIRISGAGFSSLSGPAQVYINNKLATVTSAKDTLLVAEVPVGAGTGPVKVVVNGKEAAGQTFKFQSVTAIKPLTGGKGTRVRISGSGFDGVLTGNYVEFNGKAALVVKAGEDYVIAIAPEEVSTGPLSVTVNKQKVVGPVFNVVALPVITNVTPLSGPAGTLMTINGSTFSAILEENKVTINGVNVPLKTATSTKITLAIPGGTGSGKIVLSVNDQLVQGPEFKDQSLGISKLSTDGGLPGGRVTITGTGFSTTASQNQVTFNGTPATVVSATATSLVVIVPEGFTSGPLKVAVGGFTATAPTDFNRSGVTTIAGGVGNNDLSLVGYKTGSLVVDSKGNVFVLENDKFRIKKIATDGKVTLFAGSASGVSGSDDGQATAASFSFSYNPGMAIDEHDNLFVSDYKGVRKVTPQGMVTTFSAGTGTSYKMTFDENGILYVQRGSFDGMWKIDKAGIKTAVPNRSSYAEEARPAFFGNVSYTSNYDQSGVVSYNYTTNKSGFAGSGFAGITAVIPDGTGNLYVADKYNYTISRVNLMTNEVVTIAKFSSGTNVDGSLNDAKFGLMGDMVMDKQGNLYVIDATNNAIRKITLR
jgi:hypothetical protein